MLIPQSPSPIPPLSHSGHQSQSLDRYRPLISSFCHSQCLDTDLRFCEVKLKCHYPQKSPVTPKMIYCIRALKVAMKRRKQKFRNLSKMCLSNYQKPHKRSSILCRLPHSQNEDVVHRFQVFFFRDLVCIDYISDFKISENSVKRILRFPLQCSFIKIGLPDTPKEQK